MSPAKKTPGRTRKTPAAKAPARKTSAGKASAAKAPAKSGAAKRGAGTVSSRSLPAKPRDGRVFVLGVPFDMRAVAQANGARWDAGLGAHVYAGERLPAGLEPFRSEAYSWERWREDEANGKIDVSGLADPEGIVYRPRPHQSEAVEAIREAWDASRAGFLLADEVGLGKTIGALAGALRIPGAAKILVVCTLSAVPHWRETLSRLDRRLLAGKRVAVINYDRLKKLLSVPPAAEKAKRKRTKNKAIAQKGLPLESFDVVIGDESHKLRHVSSQRATAFRRISAGAFCIWTSATAGQNPLELAYLAPLLAQATGAEAKDLAEFEAWCAEQGFKVERGAYGRWRWSYEDEEEKERDLERMQKLLFEGGGRAGGPPLGIRRLPSSIAGWPEVQRIAHPVALEAGERRLYEEAWTEFRREMELVSRGADPRNGLVANLRFRQKCSLLRVPGTAQLALDALDNGHQVAISVEFRESLEALAEEIEAAGVPCARIHGGISGADREAERRSFQRGEKRICLFTVVESISLHAREMPGGERPRTTLVHDLRYSAIDSSQIEGRCHRDGQKANVYYLYGERTVEEKIAKVLMARMKNMKTMLGDDTETLRDIERVLLAA